MDPSAPAWRQADPAAIGRALAASQRLPSGGWFVAGDSRRFRPAALRLPQRGTRNATPVGVLRGGLHPRRLTIDGHELVAWRGGPSGALRVAPAACPHMGADLADGWVGDDGCITCPWHGLGIGRSLPVHDDGVLTWVQLAPHADDATAAPILAKRPDVGIASVMTKRAECEPADVIANRLDPWHGAHFHPYAFRDLTVLDAGADSGVLTLDVTYRVVGRYGVPVRATFHCPEPRTIVMTIVDGEGTGSVVETHATPIRRGDPARGITPLTDVIEATIATSDRQGFEHALVLTPVIRPLMRVAARRLWRDDAAYAERLAALRAQEPR